MLTEFDPTNDYTNTPAVACEKPCDSLHRKLSMRGQFLLETLVGSIILEKKS